MSQRHWNICVDDPSPACAFAAAEFARLISLMDGNASATVSCGKPADEVQCLRLAVRPEADSWAGVEDPEVDDAFAIDIQNGAGFITGSNPRSVLIGVYRFFRVAGCVFLRPGRDGEYVPQRDSFSIAVKLTESAGYRHRGICLEGSNSYENVAELIDLAPKLGFNAYFTQLFRPAFAFTRWYGHVNNPTLVPTPVSNETIDSFVRDYSRELEMRGMLHHRIGHGWASRVLGITSGAWHEKNSPEEVTPGREKLIAFINGERKLFDGSGIDTNLCYSDPEAQELIAGEVVDYAVKDPQLRYLHFWLADKINNQCECEKCSGRRPADQYVELLNLIDRKLTEAGSAVKIVFLIYLDMLWEPVESRLDHPERFVLTFAPIRRSYSLPMAEDDRYEEMPFARNGFVLPPEAGGSLPYLRAWQKVFGGDSFIFDYHYMWDYLNDPGTMQGIRIMEKDVESLHRLGLNGMMSCQNQRVFIPGGLGMNILGDALWSGKADFDRRSASYLAAAYGKDADRVQKFLEHISCELDPRVLRGEKTVKANGAESKYSALSAYIDDFMPVIRKNLDTADSVQLRSWECLNFHAGLCRRISAILLAFAGNDRNTAVVNWEMLRDFARKNESHFQREFDLFEFLLVWESKILPRLQSAAEQSIE